MDVRDLWDSENKLIREGFYKGWRTWNACFLGYVSKDSKRGWVYSDVGGYDVDLDSEEGGMICKTLTPVSDSRVLEELTQLIKQRADINSVVDFASARLPDPNFDAFEDERVTGAIEHQLKQM